MEGIAEEKKEYKVNLEIKLEEKFLQSIAITAIDSGHYGIGYWASVSGDLDYDKDPICVIYERGEGGKSTMSLTLEKIALGVARVLTGKICNKENTDYVRTGVVENDAGNIDAGAADCVIQAAMFNEIVYG